MGVFSCICRTVRVVLLLAVLAIPILLVGLQSYVVSPLDERIPSPLSVSDGYLREALGGKSVLIVGGTRGIGRGTAIALARYGANVAIVGRSKESGQAVVDMMKQAALNKETQLFTNYQADFITVKGVVDFIEEIKKNNIKFDHAVVTVAVFPDWNEPYTSYGVEKTVAVMNLARFTLYKHILSILNLQADGTPSARIVNVLASGRHPFRSELDTELLTGQRRISSLIEVLGLVSSVNELFQLELKDRWSEQAVTLIGTYPGTLKTDLHANQGLLVEVVENTLHRLDLLTKEEEAGYNNAVILASPELERCGGLCYVDQYLKVRVLSDKYKAMAEKNLRWVWAYFEGLYHKGMYYNTK